MCLRNNFELCLKVFHEKRKKVNWKSISHRHTPCLTPLNLKIKKPDEFWKLFWCFFHTWKDWTSNLAISYLLFWLEQHPSTDNFCAWTSQLIIFFVSKHVFSKPIKNRTILKCQKINIFYWSYYSCRYYNVFFDACSTYFPWL